MSDTKDGIPSQDNNRLGGKILAVRERYIPKGYMLSMDDKEYAHTKVSVLYIYVNYNVIFLQFIILKII